MEKKNEVERINLSDEIKKSEQFGGKMVKIPLLSNIRFVDGKWEYEIEKYMEIPDHLIPVEKEKQH
ncbi:hypothetical protein J7E55_12235 [Bacillus sp. ISL-53]|nr:hypothetical protein [Bacillus sp. ISL-53]